MFDAACTPAESILEDHSAMHCKLKYKMDTENNQKINFPDLNSFRKLIFIRHFPENPRIRTH